MGNIIAVEKSQEVVKQTQVKKLTQTEKLIIELNELLADYHVFHQNLRGFRWNVNGKYFFELHMKFQDYYKDATLKVDEIAERILMLGGRPFHTFSDYIKEAVIVEEKEVVDGNIGVAIVLKNLSVLIEGEIEILKKARAVGDDETANLMRSYISETEKIILILNGYLNKKNRSLAG